MTKGFVQKRLDTKPCYRVYHNSKLVDQSSLRKKVLKDIEQHLEAPTPSSSSAPVTSSLPTDTLEPEGMDSEVHADFLEGARDEWDFHQRSSTERWAAIFWDLVSATAFNTSKLVFEGDKCGCGASAEYKCPECAIGRHKGFFCSPCARQHSLVGHVPLQQEPIRNGQSANDQFTYTLFVCILAGFEERSFALYNSRPVLVQLYEQGWFPASPTRPTVAFSFDFMDFASRLLVSANIAISAAYNILSSRWNRQPPSNFERQFVSSMFVFLRAKHFADKCILISLDLNSMLDAEACPCCNPVEGKFDGPAIRIADKFFSAQHRINAGKTYGTSILRSIYFQAPSDALLMPGTVSACESQLRAASQAANLDKRLDICGISGSVCPHGVLDEVIDIEKGEKFVLANTIMDNLSEKFPQNPKFFFMISPAVTASTYSTDFHIFYHTSQRFQYSIHIATDLSVRKCFPLAICMGWEPLMVKVVRDTGAS